MRWNGKLANIMLIEDTLKDPVRTIAHEFGHMADTTASETHLEKLEQCVTRRPHLEKPPRPPPVPCAGGGLMMCPGGVNIIYEVWECTWNPITICVTEEDGEKSCWREYIFEGCERIY